MRSALRLLACLIFELLVFWVPGVTGQSITLRLVNAKSGKPLSKTNVAMCTWNGTFDIHKPPYPERICVDTITDTGGIAAFVLPQAVHEHIGFQVGTPWDFAGCWHLQNPPPEKILQTGVVADYKDKCGKLRKPVSAKPGEVVIAERKLTLWEKMRREIP